jgi:hypothetical protein
VKVTLSGYWNEILTENQQQIFCKHAFADRPLLKRFESKQSDG